MPECKVFFNLRTPGFYEAHHGPLFKAFFFKFAIAGHSQSSVGLPLHPNEKIPFHAVYGIRFLGMPEEDQGRWQKFVAEPLSEMNEKNTRELGGHNPMHFSSDDDADADYNLPFTSTAQQVHFQSVVNAQMFFVLIFYRLLLLNTAVRSNKPCYNRILCFN